MDIMTALRRMARKYRGRIARGLLGLSYFGDGFCTQHAAPFLVDDRFVRAYAAARSILSSDTTRIGDTSWRLRVCCWAAQHAMKIGGVLVECGVNRGMTAMVVAEYLELERKVHPEYYLFDTFEGIPEWMALPEEIDKVRRMNTHYRNVVDEVVTRFARFPSVHVVQGVLPDVLAVLPGVRIGYLSVDLNVAVPEREVLERCWDRLLTGAVVVLDDYGWKGFERQRQEHESFARSHGVEILELPTGQGLIIKP